MKRILLSAFVFCSINATAQIYFDLRQKNDSSFIKKPLYKNYYQDSILKKILEAPGVYNYSYPNSTLLYTFPGNSRVYALPQDNMPCIVPDLSQFNMPVVGRSIKITGMPPGSSPTIPLIPPQNK